MAEPRLAAGIWVSAYLARLRLRDIPAFVVRRGDETAGAILVKQNTLDGNARVSERGYDLQNGARVWRVLCEGPEPEVDTAIAAQGRHDPDLWVIEVEDRDGRDLLGSEGLE